MTHNASQTSERVSRAPVRVLSPSLLETMTYNYDRGAAGANPLADVGRLMGRAGKAYAAYFTQKSGLACEYRGGHKTVMGVNFSWWLDTPGEYTPNFFFALDVQSRGQTVPGTFGGTAKVEQGTGGVYWGTFQNQTLDQLRDPRNYFPQKAFDDITYKLGGSAEKEIAAVKATLLGLAVTLRKFEGLADELEFFANRDVMRNRAGIMEVLKQIPSSDLSYAERNVVREYEAIDKRLSKLASALSATPQFV